MFENLEHRAQSKGWRVEVWFWSNAAGDLKKAANRLPQG
jgi:hypothetical protein